MSLSIDAAAAAGWSHLECWCGHCRVTVLLPLAGLRRRQGGAAALRVLVPRLRCSRCRRPPSQPPLLWRQGPNDRPHPTDITMPIPP